MVCQTFVLFFVVQKLFLSSPFHRTRHCGDTVWKNIFVLYNEKIRIVTYQLIRGRVWIAFCSAAGGTDYANGRPTERRGI